MERQPEVRPVRCPQCGKLARLPAPLPSRLVRCPHCKAVWQISDGGFKEEAGGAPTSPVLASASNQPPSDAPVTQPAGVRVADVTGSQTEPVKAVAVPATTFWMIIAAILGILLLLVIGIVVALILLVWQRPVSIPSLPSVPLTLPEQQPVAPPPPPAPVEDPEMARRGAATAAYLRGLSAATQRALAKLDLVSLLTGGAAIGNARQRLVEWEQAVANLNAQDVDPLAIQYKDEVHGVLRDFFLMMDSVEQLSRQIPAASPDVMLEQANKLAAIQANATSITPKLLNVVRDRAVQVEQQLEAKYHRDMPSPGLP